MDRPLRYASQLTEINMDTITKGLLTELQCEKDFTTLGFIVNRPIKPCRYDYVIDLGTKFIKVQCKSSHPINELEEAIQFCCQSTHNPKSGIHIHRNYEKEDVDFFYTSYNNQGYLIPIEQCSKTKVLRFSAKVPLKSMNWAKDYEIEKILEKEVSK